MTVPSSSGPRRVGGSPAFVSAHGIAANENIPFDQAYALAKLVVEQGGGPVSFTGKKAVISKPTVTALTNLGLLEVVGSSEFTQRVHVELNVDGRLAKLLDARYAGVKVTPLYATERLKLAAAATQAAFDLVAKYLP
jgi:hypothetical protein